MRKCILVALATAILVAPINVCFRQACVTDAPVN